MRNKRGRGVSKGGRIHPKTQEAPRGDSGGGRQAMIGRNA